MTGKTDTPGDRYGEGMATRRSVLGAAYVDRAQAAKTEFDAPFQQAWSLGQPAGNSLAPLSFEPVPVVPVPPLTPVVPPEGRQVPATQILPAPQSRSEPQPEMPPSA